MPLYAFSTESEAYLLPGPLITSMGNGEYGAVKNFIESLPVNEASEMLINLFLLAVAGTKWWSTGKERSDEEKIALSDIAARYTALAVEHGERIHQSFGFEKTRPLAVACKAGHLDAVKILVESGAEIQGGKTTFINLPLPTAISNGDTPLVEFLMAQNVNINYGDPPTWFHALKLGTHQYLDLMFERGADIHARTYEGDTALHFWLKECWMEASHSFDLRGNMIILDELFKKGHRPVGC